MKMKRSFLIIFFASRLLRLGLNAIHKGFLV